MTNPTNSNDNKPSAPHFKGSDLKLLLRLWPFIRPLWPLITLGAGLVFIAALTSVSLPYITKLAIDLYIMPVGPRVNLPQGVPPPPSLAKIMADGQTVETGLPGVFFLTPAAVNQLDARKEKELVKLGFLSTKRYYVRPSTPAETQEMMRLADTNMGADTKITDIIHPYPRLVAIEEKNLTALPDSLLPMLRGADLKGLTNLALIFSLLMFFAYGCEFSQRVILEMGAQRLSLNLRQKVLAHLFGLSQSFFDRQQSAQLTSRLTNDINNLSNLTKSTVATLFNDVVSLVAISVVMFALSPKLALFTLLFTPLAAILSIYFSRLSRKVQRNLRAKLATINHSFAETISGINIIQAFRQEDRRIEKFRGVNQDNYTAGLKQIKINAVFMPLIDLFASFSIALIIWFGGGSVLSGTLTVGVVAAFLGYTRRFFLPIQDLAEKLNLFQSALASMERLTELLDLNEKIEESPNPIQPVYQGGGMEFKGINFSYGPENPLVLKDLTFKISPGETVALAGQTGSGKSSIINLIQRSYDPNSGEIFFDGQPLKELDIKAHRARLGLVAQDVYLYGGTVMDNLRLGRQELTEDEIISAAQAVGAHRFIERLPQGYNEPLGSGGKHLSAGERQLLACARAFIEAPEIIILDEATAQVDAETEALIEEALHTLFTGRTSIVIAHRLATIRRVDRILMLHQGRIIESGTHQELLAKKGAYYNLARLQGQDMPTHK